ncbi:hypothetical protein [Staphylothermus hellenicus]|uniref:Uncharacterized protein n=1 Tax=Staphylothermus hellenicus (strain DSM 12710 / JCM 10830 / BK20S6-10-b1 / P8) TaxID=591019 RepID=D7DAR1_STAHD|nr:hypothetical protein [Staphylothermus hellenicus]ADI31258.1 hypothetical protein Shell_0111 [Staphylothermus hellenicus DSM 12710]
MGKDIGSKLGRGRKHIHIDLGEATISEHKRVVKEDLKKTGIGLEKEAEAKDTGTATRSTRPRIPRPPIIRSEPVSPSVKTEPQVIFPKVTLSGKQKAILYILYHLFREKNFKDALSRMNSVLEYEPEDILHNIIYLENQNLIKIDADKIVFTDKGEILARSIAVDNSIINKIKELKYKIPEASSIAIPQIIRKTLDKHIYQISPEILREELIVPTIPKIQLSTLILSTINKNITSIFISTSIYKDKNIVIPHIPRITYGKIATISMNKNIPPLNHEVEKKSLVKTIEKAKETVRVKKWRLPPSLLTMLFKPIKKYNVKGLISVKPDRPVIIVAIKSPDEEYIFTLLSILREIYRMKVGGLPLSRYVSAKRTKYIAEEEMMRQGLIKVIDDSTADFLEFFGISKIKDFDKINLDSLKDRLIELSVGGLSFLIFYIDENKKDQLLGYLLSIRDRIAPAKIIIVQPRKLNSELKRELARASWGFVDPSEPLLKDTLDKNFRLREEEFYNKLENIATKQEYAELVRESVEDEEGLESFESPLHYQLKVFVVYYLMKKLKIPEEDIETEAEVVKGVIPDIYVKSKRLAIEIETFYGTGLSPWRKLERTIEKYKKNNVTNEVWIIIPPLQTMLYLKDLIHKVKRLKEKGYGFIKLYTVNISKKKLIPIKEIPVKLSRLFSKQAQV